jgi:hypothetical protein
VPNDLIEGGDAQEFTAVFAEFVAELALADDDTPPTAREIDFLAALALVGTDDAPGLGGEADGSIVNLSDDALSDVPDKSGTRGGRENGENPQSQKGCDAGDGEGCLVKGSSLLPLLPRPLPAHTHHYLPLPTSTPQPTSAPRSTTSTSLTSASLHDLVLSAFPRYNRHRSWVLDRAVTARDAAHARLTAPAPVPPLLPTRWRDLTPAQVFGLSTQTTGAEGGLAFSLNLRDDVERSASRASDPVAFLAKRFSRALRAAGLAGLPFSFQTEQTGQGRLHLHGVVLVGDADPAMVKATFAQAGGKKKGRAASTQVKFDLLFDGGGWAGYCLKSARRVVPGDRQSFVSPTLKKLVKKFHGQEKAAGSPKAGRKVVTPAQRLSEATYKPASFEGYPRRT